MAKFTMKPTVLSSDVRTVRLGAGSGAGDNVGDAERGKPVKLVAESRYDLCAVGNPIEGFITSVEGGTTDAFTVGGIAAHGLVEVTFQGTQAAGTGPIAIGALVVAGTPVPKDTKQVGPPAVRLATSQVPGLFNWRVVSLGSAGTGAVGTTGVIERV